MPSESAASPSLLAPFALFVATALASQIVQRAWKKEDDSRDEAQVKRKDLRLLYATRRLSHRLSFDNLNDSPGDECATTTDGSMRRTIHTSNVTINADDDAPETFYDFHPRNRNWNHFELARWNQPPRDDEGDGYASEETDDVVGEEFSDHSSASSSLEESFLWTRRPSMVEVPEQPVPPQEPNQPAQLKTVVPGVLETITSFDIEANDERVGDNESGGPRADIFRRAEEMRQKPTPSARMQWLPDEDDALQGRGPSLLRRYLSNPEISGSKQSLQRKQEIELQIQTQNQTERAKYNARIMPNKVVMIRHGQSMGNVNESLFSTTPDNAMPLTKLGWDQARHAGHLLKAEILASGESVHFIVSPYVRTVETFHALVSAWCDPAEFKHIQDRDVRHKAWYDRLLELGLTWHEDPRIREQDFGNYQDPEAMQKSKKERHRFGVFFYRFPHGESASDVFDRVSTFLDSLWRSFDMNRSQNYVLVTHGISIRVLLARYFRYSIDQFSMLSNLRNCEMIILAHDGAGKLQLDGRCQIEHEESENGEKWVVGHSFHKRLRVLPQEWVQKVKIRISYDD